MEKTHILVRCDKSLRDAFIATAKDNDSDASKEVRKFMKSYIARYGQKASQ